MSQAEDYVTDVGGEPNAPPSDLVGITGRALVLTVLFTFVTYLVVRPMGFMQLVPPVPAMIFLLLLVGLNKLMGLAGRSSAAPRWLRPMSRGELLLVYAAVSMAPVMDRGVYIIHYLTYPQYYGTDVNQWQEFFQYFPDFYIPHDPNIVTGFWEGSGSGLVPWEAWQTPLIWWMSFNLLLMVATGCLVAFFRRQWAESERLRYPLLFLPLEISGGFEGSAVERGYFFRDPLMWTGFGIAAVFNGMRIANELIPAVPQVDRYIRVLASITDTPWRWFRPLILHFNLDTWGLSYLVPGDVLLTALAVYFGMKLIKVGGLAGGYRKWRFPFYQEVSGGACVAVTLYMLYVSRRHFRRVLERILKGPGEYDRNEPLSYRGLAIGFGVSMIAVFWMLLHAGHRWDLLLIYFAVMWMFVLVAARIRAEAGPPVAWTHPYGYDTEVAVHLLGNRFFRGYGSPQPMVLYYALHYIGRTVFTHVGGQYFTDGYRIVDYGNAKRGSAFKLMLLVLFIAGFLAFWSHLGVSYDVGQAFADIREGREHSTWAIHWSRAHFRLLDQGLENPGGPDVARSVAYGAGFLATAGITWARLNVSNFPLHPLGVVLGTLYNDWSPYWGPFLIAWLAQRLMLRYGGLPAYRRMVPGFVGLFFGHTLLGGVVLPVVMRMTL